MPLPDQSQTFSGAPGGMLANAPPMGLLSGLNFAGGGFSGAGADSMLGGGQAQGGQAGGQQPGPGLDFFQMMAQLQGQGGGEGPANLTSLLSPIGGGQPGGTLGQPGGGGLGQGQNFIPGPAAQIPPQGQQGFVAGQTGQTSTDPLAILQKLLGLVKPASQLGQAVGQGISGLGGGATGTEPPIGLEGAAGAGNLQALTTGQEAPTSQSLAQSGLFSFLNNPTLQDPTFVLNTLGLLQGGESPESFLGSLSSAQSQGLQQALFGGQEGPSGIGAGLNLGVGTNLQDPTLGSLAPSGGSLDLLGGLEGAAGAGSNLLSLINFIRSRGGGEPGRPDTGGFGTMSPQALAQFYSPAAIAQREAAFQRSQQGGFGSATEGQFDMGGQVSGQPGLAFSEMSGPQAVGTQALNQSDITGMGQAAMNLDPAGMVMAGLGLGGMMPSNFMGGGVPGQLGNQALGAGVGKGLSAIGLRGLSNPMASIQSALMGFLGLQGNQAIQSGINTDFGMPGVSFSQPGSLQEALGIQGLAPAQGWSGLSPTMAALQGINAAGGQNSLAGYALAQALAMGGNPATNFGNFVGTPVQGQFGPPSPFEAMFQLGQVSRGNDPTIMGYSGLGLARGGENAPPAYSPFADPFAPRALEDVGVPGVPGGIPGVNPADFPGQVDVAPDGGSPAGGEGQSV